MKILTLSILSLATVCVTAGAQETAAPAQSTAQADKQFLQQLERTDPAPTAVGQSSTAQAEEKPTKPAPVAKQAAPAKKAERAATASVSSERPEGELRPIEKKSKKEAGTKAVATNTEKTVPPAASTEETVETRPLRKANQDRTARTTSTLDPFYDTATRAPISVDPKPAKTSRPAAQLPTEVATGSPQTVTVTKTVTTIPTATPRDEDDGFLHRLFRHRDRSGE